MPKKAASPEIKAASFETSLSELEQIVTRLESGELPLEDALNEFERVYNWPVKGNKPCCKPNNGYKFS